VSSRPKATARSEARLSASSAPRPTPDARHPGPNARRPDPLFLALLTCFTLSGATGLVYQVVWSRMLALLFGATTAATGTVLAVFMGGLALGGWLSGRRADTLRRPLFVYGLLEGGIGLCALLVPMLFAAAVPLYRLGWQAAGGAGAVLTVVRFLLSCVVLLPPTALMGATLPVLSRLCATRPETLGARVGTLYGANMLGAAGGALLAGFVLIPALGVSGTVWATAAVNFALLIAAVALERLAFTPEKQPAPPGSLSRSGASRAGASLAESGAGRAGASLAESVEEGVLTSPPTPLPSLRSGQALRKERGEGLGNVAVQAAAWPKAQRAGVPSSKAEDEGPVSLMGARAALIGFGISGAIALVYEVAWTRALLLIIGSNIHAFAAMLATFLIGLFLGTLIAARFADRLRNPLAALAWTEAAVGVAAWLGYSWFDSLPWLNLTLLDSLPKSAAASLLVRFGLAALAMLPTALCLGALFPSAVRACGPTLARVGRTVGDLYAANTVGAILGALLASFLLIPSLGAQRTLHGAMAANVALALAILGIGYRVAGIGKRPPPVRRRFLASIAVLGVLLVAVAWPTRWDMLTLVMAQSAHREVARYLDIYHKLPYVSQADFTDQIHTDQQLLFDREGVSSHVAVIRNRFNTSLLTNGHSDGSDNVDMPTQILLAALPMLLYPAPNAPASVAVVGWGTGVTGGVVEQFPVQHLTALEIEPEVLRAADLFRHVNHDSLQDARLKRLLADGRNAFLAAPDSYAVIISEPSNVWQAGVCNLFTRDFFQLCRKRLRPGGLFTQWIGYGSVPTPEVRGILAALHTVFPFALVFRVDESDAVVVASGRPLAVDAGQVTAKMVAANPALRADLERAGIGEAPRLIARLRFGSDELPAFCQGEAPNTDDNARLEFAAALAYEQQSYSEAGQAAFAAVRPADPFKYVRFSGLSAAAQADIRQKVMTILSRPADRARLP
jgi:spermidine synthase